jgi:hypothetical protein
MKMTQCFLARAHFSIFPHRPATDPRHHSGPSVPDAPLPYYGTARRSPMLRLGRCPGQTPFSPPRAAATAPSSQRRVALPHPPAGPPSNPRRTALKRGRCVAAAPFPLFLFLPRHGHPSTPSLLASYPGSATGACHRTEIGAVPPPTLPLR